MASPQLRLTLGAYRSRTAQVLLHPATVIIIAVLARLLHRHGGLAP